MDVLLLSEDEDLVASGDGLLVAAAAGWILVLGEPRWTKCCSEGGRGSPGCPSLGGTAKSFGLQLGASFAPFPRLGVDAP